MFPVLPPHNQGYREPAYAKVIRDILLRTRAFRVACTYRQNISGRKLRSTVSLAVCLVYVKNIAGMLCVLLRSYVLQIFKMVVFLVTVLVIYLKRAGPEESGHHNTMNRPNARFAIVPQRHNLIAVRRLLQLTYQACRRTAPRLGRNALYSSVARNSKDAFEVDNIAPDFGFGHVSQSVSHIGSGRKAILA